MKMDANFEEYMENFKKYSLKEKQSIIVEQLKLLAGFTNSVCNDIGVDNDMIVNRELLDLNNDNYTEDDFAEAIIVLINSIQNSVCDFHNRFADVLESIDKNKDMES